MTTPELSPPARGHSCPPASSNQSSESGQECPSAVTLPDDEQVLAPASFLDFSQPITKYRHVLPHWEQEGKLVFVTWRLNDSMPAIKLREWSEEKARWLEKHPPPWDEQTEEAYHRTFSDRINHWLDQGRGACVLRDPAIGQRVANVLLYDDGKTVEMDCFVVMPNHVHTLFRLLPGTSLEKVMKTWKGISARYINRDLGKSGTLWQENYWDRLIRGERHFHRIRRYILQNPESAGLKDGYIVWAHGHSCPSVPKN